MRRLISAVLLAAGVLVVSPVADAAAPSFRERIDESYEIADFCGSGVTVLAHEVTRAQGWETDTTLKISFTNRTTYTYGDNSVSDHWAGRGDGLLVEGDLDGAHTEYWEEKGLRAYLKAPGTGTVTRDAGNIQFFISFTEDGPDEGEDPDFDGRAGRQGRREPPRLLRAGVVRRSARHPRDRGRLTRRRAGPAVHVCERGHLAALGTRHARARALGRASAGFRSAAMRLGRDRRRRPWTVDATARRLSVLPPSGALAHGRIAEEREDDCVLLAASGTLDDGWIVELDRSCGPGNRTRRSVGTLEPGGSDGGGAGGEDRGEGHGDEPVAALRERNAGGGDGCW